MSRFGRFTAYLRPYRLRMAIAAGLIMAVAGINLGMLWIVRRLVDTVLVQRDPASLDAAVVELGGLFLLQGLLVMGHTYLTRPSASTSWQIFGLTSSPISNRCHSVSSRGGAPAN